MRGYGVIITLLLTCLIFLPARANLPVTTEEEVTPGLITVDRPGRGAFPATAHLKLNQPGYAPPAGLTDRVYHYIRQYSEDATLMRVNLPEPWVYENNPGFPYRKVLEFNNNQMNSIVKSALGRAALEEVRGETVSTDWLARPPSNTREGFEQRAMRPGLDVSVAPRLSGEVSVSAWYRTGMFIIGADYSSRTGRVSDVRLSYPFVGPGSRGEIGITSSGAVWLNFIGEW